MTSGRANDRWSELLNRADLAHRLMRGSCPTRRPRKALFSKYRDGRQQAVVNPNARLNVESSSSNEKMK